MTTLACTSTPRSRERLTGDEPLGADGRPCPASAAFPFPVADRVPSMLTDAELNYLHWLTAQEHRGHGRVVELGCYLGGSTAALADGLLHNPHARAPMLTYDAFVMDEWSNSFLATPYAPGESFRPLFDLYQRHRADRLVVREGWIPEEVDDPAAERALYAEQEPVEILFVDAAKTWLLHDTILRTFGRHLIPGRSVLVHQDFKDPLVYWLPLHMHRLRDCFEPLDSIARSCTLSFRYVGGVAPRLAALGRPGTMSVAEIDSEWDAIDAYWAGYPCPELRPRLRLHRISHHFSVGAFDRVVEALERFAATLDQDACGSDGLQIAHAWRYLLDLMSWQLEQLEGVDPGVAAAIDALRERGLAAGDLATWSRVPSWSTAYLRHRLWRSVADRCRAQGWRRVALYGAGQHTRNLLAGGWPHGLLELVAILDDNAPGVTLAGWDVVDPRDAPRGLDAVVLSSDVYESVLAGRAARLFAPEGVPVVRIYTDDDGVGAACDPPAGEPARPGVTSAPTFGERMTDGSDDTITDGKTRRERGPQRAADRSPR